MFRHGMWGNCITSMSLVLKSIGSHEHKRTVSRTEFVPCPACFVCLTQSKQGHRVREKNSHQLILNKRAKTLISWSPQMIGSDAT